MGKGFLPGERTPQAISTTHPHRLAGRGQAATSRGTPWAGLPSSLPVRLEAQGPR